MITVRTGNYTAVEKSNLEDIFMFLSESLCDACESKYGCSIDKSNKCRFRHIVDDLQRVTLPKKE